MINSLFLAVTLCSHALPAASLTLSHIRGDALPVNTNQNQWVAFKNTDEHDKNVHHDAVWRAETGITIFPFDTPEYQMPLINDHNQIVGLFWHVSNHWFMENSRSKNVYLMQADGSWRNLGAPSNWKLQNLDLEATPPNLWDHREIRLVDFNNQEQILLAYQRHETKAVRYAIWEKDTYSYIDPSALEKIYKINDQGLLLGRRVTQTAEGTEYSLGFYNPKSSTFQPIGADQNQSHFSATNSKQIRSIEKKLEIQDLLF